MVLSPIIAGTPTRVTDVMSLGASAAVQSPLKACENASVLSANLLHLLSFLRKGMRLLPSFIPAHGRM